VWDQGTVDQRPSTSYHGADCTMPSGFSKPGLNQIQELLQTKPLLKDKPIMVTHVTWGQGPCALCTSHITSLTSTKPHLFHNSPPFKIQREQPPGCTSQFSIYMVIKSSKKKISQLHSHSISPFLIIIFLHSHSSDLMRPVHTGSSTPA